MTVLTPSTTKGSEVRCSQVSQCLRSIKEDGSVSLLLRLRVATDSYMPQGAPVQKCTVSRKPDVWSGDSPPPGHIYPQELPGHCSRPENDLQAAVVTGAFRHDRKMIARQQTGMIHGGN